MRFDQHLLLAGNRAVWTGPPPAAAPKSVRHKTATFKADRLKRLAFDVRHVFRLDDLAPEATPEVAYALVITLKTPSVANLYDQVVRTYPARLETLQPLIDIPINIRP
ncbi:hypothetical protein AB0M86_23315 [Streptomyces sp. NPDC051639]|uniref:hypothetical protein n=1 Tax=unclassified Streptomyces TaxID=2593676 RepID=UPI002E34E734|nr:hypothetical protein [Streptomyces sp. NBC_01455]